jgi:hypothetical protein
MLCGLEFVNGFPWFTISCGNIGPLSPELILLKHGIFSRTMDALLWLALRTATSVSKL